MTAAALFSYFDLFQRSGFTQQQSEGQTRALEQVIIEIKQEVKEKIEHGLESKESNIKGNISIATKELELSIEKLRTGLKTDIEKIHYDSLKFTVWTGAIVTLTLISTLGGMLAKGFHWF